MTSDLKVILMARVEKRGLIGGAKLLDGALGSVEATAANKPALEAALSRQVRALLLHPAPLYRRQCDGRGLIARITGAEDDGTLAYALERFHDDGRGGGSTHAAFPRPGNFAHEKTEGGYLPHLTIDSEPAEVARGLKRLIEHEIARFNECSK